MPLSSAVVPTTYASRYLQQLCKHFAHRIPVKFTPDEGECTFVCGVARLRADVDQLRIDVASPDEPQMAQTQDVIGSHLIRFAFRERLEPLQWQENVE